MEQKPIIQTKKLTLHYGDFEALKGIDMDIMERQVTAFIGPSGCGKSTFLKTLNRMQDLVPGVRINGDVTFHGKDIFAKDVDVTWLRKKIGMVFQKPNPFPMSIMDRGCTVIPAMQNWMRLWRKLCVARPFGMK